MRLLITGSPGTGKTRLARLLGEKLKCKVINERGFALEKSLGIWDEDENELLIPIDKIGREANKILERQKDIIFEGHTLCETKLNIDYVILLRADPEVLELRLEKRGYKADKIMDNVFCEGIDYCKKHIERNYPKEKIIEVKSRNTAKETAIAAMECLIKKGAL